MKFTIAPVLALTMFCGVALAQDQQAPQTSNAPAESSTANSKDQQKQLKTNEKAAKEQAKSDKAQRKALKQEEKANKAAAKAQQ